MIPWGRAFDTPRGPRTLVNAADQYARRWFLCQFFSDVHANET